MDTANRLKKIRFTGKPRSKSPVRADTLNGVFLFLRSLNSTGRSLRTAGGNQERAAKNSLEGVQSQRETHALRTFEAAVNRISGVEGTLRRVFKSYGNKGRHEKASSRARLKTRAADNLFICFSVILLEYLTSRRDKQMPTTLLWGIA